MRFFLAGIMQGSHTRAAVHSQDYRAELKQLLEAHFPQAEIYDPRANHAQSLGYDDPTGRSVFFHHNQNVPPGRRAAGFRARGVNGHGHRDVGSVPARRGGGDH